jgi:phage/plasmid-associated DNA primase
MENKFQNKINNNNMTSESSNNIITEKSLDKEFKDDSTYQLLFNSEKTPPFKLNNIENTYELARKFNHIFFKEIKYCNNEWIVLNKFTNLWNKVKKPNIYIYQKLIVGLNNFKKDLDMELKKAHNSDDKELIKCYNEKLEIHNKNYLTIDLTGWINRFKENLAEFIKDDDFETKLDNNPYKIAFKNGIYDIKTKEFTTKIQPSYYLSKTLDFDYDENIKQENIDFIHSEIQKICNMNKECKDYYLSILAYALCGDPSRYEDIYCLIGQSASNGKSKLIEALMDIFPIYVGKSNVKVFESTFDKKHKFILDFAKYRLLYLNEFDEKKLIDSQMFKEISDGDRISNEVMFGTTDNIKLKAKPFITSNYTPKFDKQDKGVERRYRHLQFNSVFGDEEDIENLKFLKNRNFKQDIVNCRNELVHILLTYANNVYINGLPAYPSEYEEEKKTILGMNNEFGDWFDTSKDILFRIKKGEYASSHLLLNEFNNYALQNNFEPLKKNREFVDKMKQLGYKYDRQKYIDGKKGAIIGLYIPKVETDSK